MGFWLGKLQLEGLTVSVTGKQAWQEQTDLEYQHEARPPAARAAVRLPNTI